MTWPETIAELERLGSSLETLDDSRTLINARNSAFPRLLAVAKAAEKMAEALEPLGEASEHAPHGFMDLLPRYLVVAREALAEYRRATEDANATK